MRLMLNVVLALVVIRGATTEQTGPKIKLHEISEVPFVFETGATVILRCPVEHTDNTYYEWLKDNEAVEEYGRFRVRSNGALKFKSARPEDSGVYTCKAIDGFGSVDINTSVKVVGQNTHAHEKHKKLSDSDNAHPVEDDQVQVTVVRKGKKAPFLLDTSPYNEITKTVGQVAEFLCNAGGQPRPEIKWFKNKAIVKAADLPLGSSLRRGSLVINNLRPDHAGQYLCVAYNSNGQVNSTFELRVNENRGNEPQLVEGSLLNTTVAIGDTAALNCKVISASKPHMQWLKKTTEEYYKNADAKQVLIDVKGDHYYVVESSEEIFSVKNMHHNRLIIKNARIEDSGKYVCFAANTQGYNYRTAYLEVISGNAAQEITYRNIEVRGHTIEASPGSSIIWVSLFCVVFLIFLIIMGCVYRHSASIPQHEPCCPAEGKLVMPTPHPITSTHTSYDQERFSNWIVEQNSVANMSVDSMDGPQSFIVKPPGLRLAYPRLPANNFICPSVISSATGCSLQYNDVNSDCFGSTVRPNSPVGSAYTDNLRPTPGMNSF